MKEKTTLAVAICLLTIMVSACHDKKQDVMEDVTFTDFPEVIELKGEGHVLDDRQAMLRYPFRIHAYGDYLFIFDMHNADEFGHIYDKKTSPWMMTASGSFSENSSHRAASFSMILTALPAVISAFAR